MAKYKCSVCGANAENEQCWRHKPKTPLKSSSRLKARKKTKEEIEKNKEETEKMWAFFLDIWDKRPHYSEVSREWLGHEALSIYFHHILPKSKYIEAKYDPENIILLTFDEHQKVEQNPSYFTLITERQLKLLLKYGSQ
jgi:hypothetical protein